MSWTEHDRRKGRERYARIYKKPHHERTIVIPRADVDLIRELSEVARDTRKPGQTMEQRLKELRREADDLCRGVFGA